MEHLIASELSRVNGVEVVTTSDLAAAYPLAEYYDHHADKLAHIPYTSVFYTALGTMLARRLYALKAAPYKAIVLDCDGTLWAGICGEDGLEGIQIDAARRALQEFMVQQHDRGMLLCICSKNNAEDVLEVFDCRSDMVLRRNHITAWRVNWRPKSENIRFLSQELGLGLTALSLSMMIQWNAPRSRNAARRPCCFYCPRSPILSPGSCGTSGPSITGKLPRKIKSALLSIGNISCAKVFGASPLR